MVIGLFMFGFADSNAQFSSAVKYYTGNAPKLVLVRDFNNDSRKDLAVLATTTVRILHQQSDGSFDTGINLTGFHNLSSMAADDYDGDGDIDLLLADQSENTITVYLNNISGFYAGQVISCTQPYDLYSSTSLDPEEWRGPGFFVACISTNTVRFYRNNGNAQFSLMSSETVPSPWKLVFDEYLHRLIVPSWEAETTWYCYWLNNPAFGDPSHLPSRGLIRSAASGEFYESMGHFWDLALTCRSDSTIKIFEGIDAFGYSYAFSIELPNFVPYEIATGDFDNDGDDDLAVIDNRADGKLWLGIKSGNNIIGSLIDHIGANPRDIEVYDVDMDGNVDLVVTFTGEDSVGIFYNGEGSSGCSYAVGDVNNNGSFNGLDVVYSVSYFKGGPPPSYSCECTPGNTWFVAGDVNASCNFNGLDVSYMVSYLKGGPAPHPCANGPPAR